MAQLLKHVRQSMCSAAREAATMGRQSPARKNNPHSLQLENASVQQQGPSATKNKTNLKKASKTHGNIIKIIDEKSSVFCEF